MNKITKQLNKVYSKKENCPTQEYMCKLKNKQSKALKGSPMNLTLEVNSSFKATKEDLGLSLSPCIITTPAIGKKGYWLYRVKVSKTQAVIGFPKFYTIGIGFQKETDWNTNLPKFYTIGIGFQKETDWNTNLPFKVPTKEIFNHIKENKGKGPKDEDCIQAIQLIQNAAKKLTQTQLENL
jgi:hypothetical protein